MPCRRCRERYVKDGQTLCFKCKSKQLQGTLNHFGDGIQFKDIRIDGEKSSVRKISKIVGLTDSIIRTKLVKVKDSGELKINGYTIQFRIDLVVRLRKFELYKTELGVEEIKEFFEISESAFFNNFAVLELGETKNYKGTKVKRVL